MVSSLSSGFGLPGHHRLFELAERRRHRESALPATREPERPGSGHEPAAEIDERGAIPARTSSWPSRSPPFKDRAEAICGTLSFESAPGLAAMLTVELPHDEARPPSL